MLVVGLGACRHHALHALECLAVTDPPSRGSTKAVPLAKACLELNYHYQLEFC